MSAHHPTPSTRDGLMPVRVRFALRTGLRGHLTVLAASTWAALEQVQMLYGLDLCMANAMKLERAA